MPIRKNMFLPVKDFGSMPKNVKTKTTLIGEAFNALQKALDLQTLGANDLMRGHLAMIVQEANAYAYLVALEAE